MSITRVRTTNATIHVFKDVTVLYSYATPVAAKDRHGTYRTSSWYSVTTTRHINEWLKREPMVKEMPQSFFDNLVDKAVKR